MTKKRWDTTDIPDQSGRVAIVTGANSGIGSPRRFPAGQSSDNAINTI